MEEDSKKLYPKKLLYETEVILRAGELYKNVQRLNELIKTLTEENKGFNGLDLNLHSSYINLYSQVVEEFRSLVESDGNLLPNFLDFYSKKGSLENLEQDLGELEETIKEEVETGVEIGWKKQNILFGIIEKSFETFRKQYGLNEDFEKEYGFKQKQNGILT